MAAKKETCPNCEGRGRSGRKGYACTMCKGRGMIGPLPSKQSLHKFSKYRRPEISEEIFASASVRGKIGRGDYGKTQRTGEAVQAGRFSHKLGKDEKGLLGVVASIYPRLGKDRFGLPKKRRRF